MPACVNCNVGYGALTPEEKGGWREQFCSLKCCDDYFVEKAEGSEASARNDDRQDFTALFHKLWSRDVGTPGYCKDDWKRLRLYILAYAKVDL